MSDLTLAGLVKSSADRTAVLASAEQKLSSPRNLVRMPAIHPEPTSSAGIKRQILSTRSLDRLPLRFGEIIKHVR
jgi:hypothetical protein